MDNIYLLDKLQNSIKIDIELSKQVAVLLEKERESISVRDIDEMESLSKSKIEIYEKLRKNQESRDNLQNALDLNIGFNGLKDLITRGLDIGYKELKPMIKELEKLLLKVNELNITNAKIIAISHNQVSGILDVMFQKGENTECYGSDAQIQSNRSSNKVQKA